MVATSCRKCPFGSAVEERGRFVRPPFEGASVPLEPLREREVGTAHEQFDTARARTVRDSWWAVLQGYCCSYPVHPRRIRRAPLSVRDRFSSAAASSLAPACRPFVIVPHDRNRLPTVSKGLHTGGGGDVTLRSVEAASDVTHRNLPHVSYISVCASHVRATGTTATDMIAEA